jgi:hypothetical protein
LDATAPTRNTMPVGVGVVIENESCLDLLKPTHTQRQQHNGMTGVVITYLYGVGNGELRPNTWNSRLRRVAGRKGEPLHRPRWHHGPHTDTSLHILHRHLSTPIEGDKPSQDPHTTTSCHTGNTISRRHLLYDMYSVRA